MTDLKIIFMGTPEFAVPSLKILVDAGYEIAGVITAPDKPKGRGRKISFSPVKEYALQAGLKVLQPTNLKDQDFLSELKNLGANLQVVVAFRMLPEVVWAMPEIGTFNLHASLLPQYRGAAPINWAIINGESETGVTTFFLKHEIDTGSILFQKKEPIHPEDNTGTLYDRLMIKGAELVLETVRAIESNSITPRGQEESKDLKHAPKLFREDCQINWENPSQKVQNFIRGLSPYPGAWIPWKKEQIIKIYKTVITDEKAEGTPGTRKSDNKSYFYVKTEDNWISVLELQLQGKRKMTISEFLRGNEVQ